jgi:hypothetical protein
LVILVVSAGAGFVLREVVSRKVASAVLVLGLGALMLGVVVLGLTVVGWAPFGTWTGAVAAVFLFGAAALVIPFALAAGCCRSSTDSVTLFLLCVGMAGAAPVRAQSPMARCAAPNARVSIDHVVVAVTDLDAASDTYAELGFTWKDGRLHWCGWRPHHGSVSSCPCSARRSAVPPTFLMAGLESAMASLEVWLS